MCSFYKILIKNFSSLTKKSLLLLLLLFILLLLSLLLYLRLCKTNTHRGAFNVTDEEILFSPSMSMSLHL